MFAIMCRQTLIPKANPSGRHDRLVTMKPTRGYNSPRCRSTLATTLRILFYDLA